MLPFTPRQFLSVFVNYDAAIAIRWAICWVARQLSFCFGKRYTQNRITGHLGDHVALDRDGL